MKIRLTKPVSISGGRALWTGEEYDIIPGSVTGPEENKHPGYCEILIDSKPERVY